MRKIANTVGEEAQMSKDAEQVANPVQNGNGLITNSVAARNATQTRMSNSAVAKRAMAVRMSESAVAKRGSQVRLSESAVAKRGSKVRMSDHVVKSVCNKQDDKNVSSVTKEHDNSPHSKERRGWRDGNLERGFNGSFFDERGRELLGRWLNGSGESLIAVNGSWGSYMQQNESLKSQIKNILSADAAKRSVSGVFSYSGSALIENGYSTGYQMLHGTNSIVGGFQMHGHAIIGNNNQIIYSLALSWHDIIDPNPEYIKDMIYSGVFHTLYSPKDYNIHIYWNEYIAIPKK